MTPGTQEAQRSARAEHIEAERQFLASQTDLSEDLLALLAEASLATDMDAAPAVTLPDGTQVPLPDLGTRLIDAAATYRRAHDPAEALAAYTMSHGLLSDALKAQLTPPEVLAGAALADVQQAAQQMNEALGIVDDLDHTRIADDAAEVSPQAFASVLPRPGNGTDNDEAGLSAPRRDRDAFF